MKKAFTLIELLVVIAIIAILAAMLMPALTKARIEAKKANCKSNEHTFGLQYTMYLNDFNGWYPTALDPSGGVSGSVQTQGDLKECLGALYPEYMDAERIYICPGKETVVELLEDNGDAPDESTATGTGYTTDLLIPRTADPARAVLGDIGTFNHPDGANILFADTHVKWQKEEEARGWVSYAASGPPFDGFTVESEYMNLAPMEDTDVYECGDRPSLYHTTQQSATIDGLSMTQITTAAGSGLYGISQDPKFDCNFVGQDD